MKVLIPTFTYPPNADGVAQATAVLANGLAARGHEVTIATEYHPERKPNSANPRIEQFKVSGNANWRVGIRGECQKYQEFIRRFECDAMIFECWDVWSTHLAIPIFKLNNAKKILVSHGYTAHLWIPFRKPLWGLGPWLGGLPLVAAMPFVMRKFDHLVVLSQAAAWDRFLDHWVAKATGFRRCSVIPNGAFTQEFAGASSSFREEFGIGDGTFLLCVANYCDRKNQVMALRAFCRARLENATLVFIGSEFNDYSVALQQLAHELKKEFKAARVIFLEKISRERTCAAFREAELFILSAKAETQPIVLLEAMASKTPWISTDTGCVAELPGGVVVREELEMADQIRYLANSVEAREKLADAGWSASRSTYDWESVINRYVTLLAELAAEQKSGLKPAARLLNQ